VTIIFSKVKVPRTLKPDKINSYSTTENSVLSERHTHWR